MHWVAATAYCLGKSAQWHPSVIAYSGKVIDSSKSLLYPAGMTFFALLSRFPSKSSSSCSLFSSSFQISTFGSILFLSSSSLPIFFYIFLLVFLTGLDYQGKLLKSPKENFFCFQLTIAKNTSINQYISVVRNFNRCVIIASTFKGLLT